MSPRRVALVVAASFLAHGVCGAAGSALEDAFDVDGPPALGTWETICVGGPRAQVAQVREGALALGLDTIGTEDATVKVLGVRARAPLDLTEGGLQVGVSFDWNQQTNGCYLSQGLLLVPLEQLQAQLEAGADPRLAPDAVGFEVIGVPPGKNVRPSLWRRSAGSLHPLFTDGWPQARREERVGRPPRPTRFDLRVWRDRLELVEDGREIWSGKTDTPLPSRLALVLFVTSHSNYPLRTVRFEHVVVEALVGEASGRGE